MLRAITNDTVEIYYNNEKRLHTTPSGVDVTGTLNVTGVTTITNTLTLTNDLFMSDGDQIEIGTDNDLKIFHSGFNYIESHNDVEVHINAYTGGAIENMAKFKPNGSVELYNNGTKKFETTSGGIVVTGQMYSNSGMIVGAAGGDSSLELYSDGGSQDADKVRIRQTHVGNSFLIESYASGAYQSILKGTDSRTIELHYQGSKKFETTSSGVSVTGNVILGDAEELQMGNSTDFQIFHGGTNSHIVNSTNELRIRSNDLRLMNAAGNEHYFVGFSDSYAAMYYDNTQRIKTLTDGAQVKGVHHIVSEDGNSTITEKAFYYAVNTNSSVTVTLSSLNGTGSLTVGGYANAGQGAIAFHVLFGGAMFGTQHYNVDILQEGAMQNTSISKTKNATSYVVTIANTSSSYTLNLNFGLKSQGAEMGLAFS